MYYKRKSRLCRRHERIQWTWGEGGAYTIVVNIGTTRSEWPASCRGRFTPGRETPTSMEQEIGRVPELELTFWGGKKKNPLPLPGYEPRIAQPLA